MEFTYRIIDFLVSSGHLTKDEFLCHHEARIKRWALCHKTTISLKFSFIPTWDFQFLFSFLLQPSAPGFLKHFLLS